MKALTAIRTAIVAIAALAATAAVSAQGPGMGMGEHRPPMERMLGPLGAHGRWWNDPTVIQKLNLTDDQRQAMDEILQQNRDKLIDLRGSVEKAEGAMQPLISADQPNESAVLAQIDKIAQARAELEKANARFLLALRAKLTPDQWKQLQAMRAEHRDEMRRQWHGHGNAPGGAGAPGTPEPPPPPGPQSLMDQEPGPGPDGGI